MKSRPSHVALLVRAALLPLLFSAGSIRAADYVSTVEATPNLVGYYRFSTASQANSVVNGFTGTLNGNAALTVDGFGPPIKGDSLNSALALDGTNNTYVDTNLSGHIDSQGTIMAWFNLSKMPSDTGRILFIAGISQVGNDFDLQIETDNKIKFFTDSGSATVAPDALTTADLGKWHFVAASFTSATDRKLYLDGVLIASSTPGGHSLTNGRLGIGASNVFGNRFFTGDIDEVAVFDRDLTATEISAIYQQSSAGTPPGLITSLSRDNGLTQLFGTGARATTYQVQSSYDLTTFSAAGNVTTDVNGVFTFEEADTSPMKFYRLVQP